jgi:hypothetical protein
VPADAWARLSDVVAAERGARAYASVRHRWRVDRFSISSLRERRLIGSRRVPTTPGESAAKSRTRAGPTKAPRRKADWAQRDAAAIPIRWRARPSAAAVGTPSASIQSRSGRPSSGAMSAACRTARNTTPGSPHASPVKTRAGRTGTHSTTSPCRGRSTPRADPRSGRRRPSPLPRRTTRCTWAAPLNCTSTTVTGLRIRYERSWQPNVPRPRT